MPLAVNLRAWIKNLGGPGSWRHQSASDQGCAAPALLETVSHPGAFSKVRMARLTITSLPTKKYSYFQSFLPYTPGTMFLGRTELVHDSTEVIAAAK